MRHTTRPTAPVALTVLAAAAILAAAPPTLRAQASAKDSTAVVSTVEAFHAALAHGDSAAALALLDPRAQIVEAGGVENLAHYREHHLPGDIGYARATKTVRTIVQVDVRGDAAWIVSTSATTGESGGRAINSQGAELAVLARSGGAWRIAAFHWSSRARRAPAP